MAVPQRRISKTRKRLRRTHFKLTIEGLITCPNCGEMIKAHHVCPKCGYYAGKPVLKDGKLIDKNKVEKPVATGKKSVRAKEESKKQKEEKK